MGEVFVSYASGDKDTAFRIAEYLESQGIGCWIAPRDVPPGKDYGAAILDGIAASSALVLILSEEANDSTFVRKEVERAVSKGKPVLPVRIREVTPSGALEFFVSSSQWVDAWRSPMEQHLSKLSDAIVALRGDGAPRTAPAKPALSAPRRRKGPILAAAAVAMAVAAGTGAWAWKPWLPAWQRSAADFLAGSWCVPMSGDAIARLDFVRATADAIRGELHFSHSYDVVRMKANVAPNDIGIVLDWTEPETYVQDGPSVYRVIDEVSFNIVPEDPQQTDIPVWTRCPPDSGN